MLPVAGSTPTAPVTPAPAPAVANPSSPTPAASPAPQNDFGSALRKEMESRLMGSTPSSNPSGSPSLPSGLVAGAAPASPAPQPPAPPIQPPAVKPPETPAPVVPPTVTPETPAARVEPPSSLRIEKFGREFSLPEIEAAIEGFNYYHPKVMQLQENLTALEAGKKELETGKQEIAQLRSSPDMMFLEFMSKSPEFRSSVAELCAKFDPSVVTNHQNATSTAANQNLQTLQKTVEQQAAELKQLKEGTVSREEREWKAYEQSVHQGIDRNVQGEIAKLKGEGIEITNDDLTNIARAAGALVKAKQMEFSVDALSKFFTDHIGSMANRFRAVRTSATSQQAHEKAQLPPPPPSGGSAPVLTPNSPKTSAEFAKRMAESLGLALQRS